MELPERCDSPSAVSGLPQENQACCPERWPCDDNEAEEECVEGLTFPPVRFGSLLQGWAFRKRCSSVSGHMGSIQGQDSLLLELFFAGSPG